MISKLQNLFLVLTMLLFATQAQAQTPSYIYVGGTSNNNFPFNTTTSNNGGWQWAAGSGCDAAPYFRVFNPYLQTKKFDPDLKYVRKWVPEFEDFSKYPEPIVDHKEARERCLKVYKAALKDKMKDTSNIE